MRSASVYGRRRQLAPWSPALFDVDEPQGVFDRRTAVAVSLPVSSVTITWSILQQKGLLKCG